MHIEGFKAFLQGADIELTPVQITNTVQEVLLSLVLSTKFHV